MKTLTSTNEVIDALGGNTKLAKKIFAHHHAVSNWRRKHEFPASTYRQLKKLLNDANLDAPDELWAMRPLNHKRKKK